MLSPKDEKGVVMKIALPLTDATTIYKDNPYTAPKFGIYKILGDKSNISFSLYTIIDNPWHASACKLFNKEQRDCNCDKEVQESIEHKCEHYALLDLIHDCHYLLANKYCENTKKSMQSGGISIVNIPPIITSIESAIKNFLIGASLASTVKHIHYAA